MARRKLTVEAVLELLPNFRIAEEAEGIRIRKDAEYNELDRDLNAFVAVMKAALELQLDPEQLQDQSRYEDNRSMGSSWTGEYGSQGVAINVLFRFKP